MQGNLQERKEGRDAAVRKGDSDKPAKEKDKPVNESESETGDMEDADEEGEEAERSRYPARVRANVEFYNPAQVMKQPQCAASRGLPAALLQETCIDC